MSKVILIIIIVAIIIFIAIAGYLIAMNSGEMSPLGGKNNSQATNFEIQGMKIEIVRQGSGESAKEDDRVTVNYVGKLENGKQFDSSYDRKVPFSFELGAGRVIKGWDLGVLGMKVGEKRMLTIPPELAYGKIGFPPVIPENATLTFEVELLGIQ